MPILKLERMDRERGLRYTDICYVWINTDQVETFAPRSASVTDLTMASGAQWLVGIAPDELAGAIDPENACPEPGRCGYQEYLAYRQDGQSDLGHGAYHAAVKLAEAHAASCTVYERGPCPTCRSHEKRLRA